MSLFRKLRSRLGTGDVLLGDRHFCAYFDIAAWLRLGVDFVGRLHQARRDDLRYGKRLGPGDRLVEWSRPKQRPRWLSRRAYRRMPETLTLRLMRVTVAQPGFRTRRITVVTTLLDCPMYPVADVAALYRARWHAETTFQEMRAYLGLETTRGRTQNTGSLSVWSLLRGGVVLRGVAQTRAARRNDFVARQETRPPSRMP